MLPIIESCDGCGACCMAMECPPSYGWRLGALDQDSEEGERKVAQYRADPLSACYTPEWLERNRHQLTAELQEYASVAAAEEIADWERVHRLPAEAAALVRAGLEGPSGAPCTWLDMETRRCRFYDLRPSICRTAIERGDEGCRGWRKQFGIDQEEGEQ